MFWLCATLLWLLFAVLAIGLGALRVTLLEPLMGEPAAHVLGTLVGCSLFFALIFRFVGWTMFSAQGQRFPTARRKNRLVALGLFWTLATIIFEFGFGRLVMGHSWARLLADYNFLAGRVWVLVLLTLYAGPRLAGWVIARRKR
ncbi:MAG: hypothetical protein KKF77_10785 [Proteobacteria bacterium]|nr:hypothetical protein [Pseudomonadota bacterium]